MEQTSVSPEGDGAKEVETVAIPEASDADLNAFLESSFDGEEGADDGSLVPPELTGEEGDEPSLEEESDNAPANTTAEPVAEKKEAEAHKEQPPAKSTEEQVVALRRQIEGLELLMQRRTSEIGTLKQSIKAEIEPLKQKLEKDEHDSPYQAFRDAETLREKEKQLEALDAHEGLTRKVVENQKVVLQHLGEELPVDEIAKCLVADNIPSELVGEFRKSPYSMTDSITLIQYAKRAKAENIARQLFDMAKKQEAEIKQLKAKPNAVLSKVNQALRSRPSVSAANGGGASADRASAVSVHDMSDSELEEFLKSKR
jgi:hypothetical protein